MYSTQKAAIEVIYTINDTDMLSYSLTTMMCFLTKEWCGFSAYTVSLFIKTYHRITYKEDLKSHKSTVSLRWYVFLCGFDPDVFFTIDYLRSISFFCQNAHHDWLTKEYISNWFLVIKLASSKFTLRWLLVVDGLLIARELDCARIVTWARGIPLNCLLQYCCSHFGQCPVFHAFLSSYPCQSLWL